MLKFITKIAVVLSLFVFSSVAKAADPIIATFVMYPPIKIDYLLNN